MLELPKHPPLYNHNYSSKLPVSRVLPQESETMAYKTSKDSESHQRGHRYHFLEKGTALN